MFKAIILNPKRTIFEGNVNSVFLPGTEGEFEVMEFHKPIISLLRPGQIVINWKESVKISRGIVMMQNNELVALVEE